MPTTSCNTCLYFVTDCEYSDKYGERWVDECLKGHSNCGNKHKPCEDYELDPIHNIKQENLKLKTRGV